MAPWQAIAQREWGTTAVWIQGSGQYAVLHPCSDELTVTLCATPEQAKDAKAYQRAPPPSRTFAYPSRPLR